VESLGGKLESFYCALGADDVVTIVDLPDNVSAAALSVTVSASGLVHSRTTALLTVEEADKALGLGALPPKPEGNSLQTPSVGSK
jgi:uncharacterized protein with GYD domain